MLRIHTIVYTGYHLEDIIDMARVIPEYWTILTSADILVDGPFIQETTGRADPDCQYRGSRNQRVIDLRQTFDVRQVLQRAPIVALDREWDDQHLVSISPEGMIHFSAAVRRIGVALGGRVRPARNCGRVPAHAGGKVPAHAGDAVPAHVGSKAPAHAGDAVPAYAGEANADD
jgi:hypothetical protein